MQTRNTCKIDQKSSKWSKTEQHFSLALLGYVIVYSMS